jgi:hypothetical protein
MAYYGDLLDQLTDAGRPNATPMGSAATSFDQCAADEMNFLIDAMGEIAVAQGLSGADIAAAELLARQELGATATPMSTALGRRLVSIARALEGLSPWKGGIALQVIRQAYAYLAHQWICEPVDNRVRPYFTEDKTVIISHSLGTVVGFRMLRELSKQGFGIEVPLLVSVGSPLALDAVKAKIGVPRRKPTVVQNWRNYFDKGDPVTLGKPLDKANFAPEIHNDGSINNKATNGHSIDGYLDARQLIAALNDVLP